MLPRQCAGESSACLGHGIHRLAAMGREHGFRHRAQHRAGARRRRAHRPRHVSKHASGIDNLHRLERSGLQVHAAQLAGRVSAGRTPPKRQRRQRRCSSHYCARLSPDVQDSTGWCATYQLFSLSPRPAPIRWRRITFELPVMRAPTAASARFRTPPGDLDQRRSSRRPIEDARPRPPSQIESSKIGGMRKGPMWDPMFRAPMLDCARFRPTPAGPQGVPRENARRHLGDGRRSFTTDPCRPSTTCCTPAASRPRPSRPDTREYDPVKLGLQTDPSKYTPCAGTGALHLRHDICREIGTPATSGSSIPHLTRRKAVRDHRVPEDVHVGVDDRSHRSSAQRARRPPGSPASPLTPSRCRSSVVVAGPLPSNRDSGASWSRRCRAPPWPRRVSCAGRYVAPRVAKRRGPPKPQDIAHDHAHVLTHSEALRRGRRIGRSHAALTRRAAACAARSRCSTSLRPFPTRRWPPRLAHGLFTKPGVYPGRRSASPTRNSHILPRSEEGRARLFVRGSKLPPGVIGPFAGRQDFSMNNARTFPINDAPCVCRDSPGGDRPDDVAKGFPGVAVQGQDGVPADRVPSAPCSHARRQIAFQQMPVLEHRALPPRPRGRGEVLPPSPATATRRSRSTAPHQLPPGRDSPATSTNDVHMSAFDFAVPAARHRRQDAAPGSAAATPATGSRTRSVEWKE